MYKLSKADGEVVDRFMQMRNGGRPRGKASERMAAVVRVFELIGAMPAHEPSGDLAARTLQAIGGMDRRRRAAHADEMDAAQQMRPQL